MRAAFLPRHVLVSALAVILAVIASAPPPAAHAADNIDISITSSATPLPGNPMYPHGQAQYGSTVTFTVAASGNSYDDFVVTISCPNTALDPSTVSPAADTVTTANNTTQLSWTFHDTGSGGGTFSAVAGIVAGDDAVPCSAHVGGNSTDPSAFGFGNAYYTVELTTDVPPTAAFTATQDDDDHMKFTFDAAASTAAGSATIASYAWDFDDGKTATGKKVTHTFAKPGKFAVELTVTDSKNLADSDTQEVTATPSIEIESVEVTQAIQVLDPLITLKSRLQNTGEPLVPIISGKPAVMRVYFSEVEAATTVSLEVTGVLTATKTIDWQPHCSSLEAREHAHGCPSLDFYFTPPSGTWQMKLKLTDVADEPLQEETLNFKSRDTSAIRLVGVSVCDGATAASLACASASDILGKTEIIRKIMPTSSVVTEVSSNVVQRIYVPDPSDTTDDKLIHNFLIPVVRGVDKLFTPTEAASDTAAKQRTTFFGIYRHALGDTGIAHDIPAHGAMAADFVLRFNREATAQCITHETGHTLGLRHTNTQVPATVNAPGCYGFASDSSTDWPYSNNYLQHSGSFEWGFDVETKTLIDPNTTFDIMSYCFPRWISPLRFFTAAQTLAVPVAPLAALRTQLGAPALLASGSFFDVSGTFPAAGGVALDPIFTVTTEGSNDAGEGTHRIEVQNGSGGILFTRFFTPAVATTETTGADVHGDPAFAELVPVMPGTVRVIVKDANGGVLGTVTRTGVEPTVGVTSPANGFIGTGVKPVTWTVEDFDSHAFTSRILFSADNGATWSQIGEIPDVTSLPVNFDGLPGTTGTTALVRIFVSDGVNTGSATSPAFAIPKKAPADATIDSPATGFAQAAVDPIVLVGHAYDVDDGVLGGSQLQWSSSLQGALGSGSPLSTTLQPGAHTLTLTATDSDGHAVTDTTDVVIGGDPPDLDVTTAPASGGCTTVTIAAAPGTNGAALASVQYTLDAGVSYTTIPLTALPFSLVAPGTGSVTVTARAYDLSQQSSAQSVIVENPPGCAAHGPVCIGGTTISKAKLAVKKLGAPLGDEQLSIKGTLDFGPGTPATFDPAGKGVQLLVEDLGSGNASAFDLTHFTVAIPPGPVTTACGKKDGWKKLAYANKSGALDPPTCTAKSAKGSPPSSSPTRAPSSPRARARACRSARRPRTRRFPISSDRCD